MRDPSSSTAAARSSALEEPHLGDTLTSEARTGAFTPLLGHVPAQPAAAGLGRCRGHELGQCGSAGSASSAASPRHLHRSHFDEIPRADDARLKDSCIHPAPTGMSLLRHA